LRLCSATYFILASLYSFFAYTPFTYLFVIVNPPYRWISTFANHNVLLLWIAVAGFALSEWLRNSPSLPRVMKLAVFGFAVFISIDNPIPHLQNNMAALAWSMGFLLPLLIIHGCDLVRRAQASGEQLRYSSIAYSDAILIGLLAGLISIMTLRLHGGFIFFERYDAELLFWVEASHATVAVLVASIINLMKALIIRHNRNAFILGSGIVGFVVFVGLAFGCLLFIEDSLSLRGRAIWGYSILLAATVTVVVLTLLEPIVHPTEEEKINRGLLMTVVLVLVGLAIYVPLAIDPGDDWNGILHETFALLLWATLAISICRMRSLQKQYSIGTILAVALATSGVYQTLSFSKPFWAADIGTSKMLIQRELDNYSAQNASFRLVDAMLGNREWQRCDANCKILRQYSNIRSAKITRALNIVDKLEPTTGPKPNIFIIVIDSLRPDYLGIYNPLVDFTPNIDSFARDSIAMRQAYSDYAGTSLSEPSIWSGALLLHAHYAQPFQQVNSLEKLARIDDYQMVISYDEILRELIAPSNDLIKLDTDKKAWGQFEISSTIRQLEDFLDHRGPEARPVFFYTQAMNVQVHADNNLPKRTSQNWRTRPGFDERIAYTLHQTDDFLGAFFAYLKSKSLYDNSIIILTADHGDATGELGRIGHSTIIYPEVMRIPLIVHLPLTMQRKYVYDENRISTLIDIAPSLYFLLGHGPIKANPLLGRPMFLENSEEFGSYPRPDLFLASDSLAVYGILAGDGRWMYTTYDSPPHSSLFDLLKDPNAQENILTPDLKKRYDDQILHDLQLLSKFYGYQPTGG
jgi:hypothetical protein